jgi:hypothetical protein
MEGTLMKKWALILVVLMLVPAAAYSEDKPIIVVQPFTLAKDVTWPYDVKVMQAQTVAEFKVELGKNFEIMAEAPVDPKVSVYSLDTQVTGWRKGNAATRMIVGFGAGRESADIQYSLTDATGKKVLDKKDTVRTNFYAQMAGSSGTLTHPFAIKIAERIKDAKLK